MPSHAINNEVKLGMRFITTDNIYKNNILLINAFRTSAPLAFDISLCKSLAPCTVP